MLISEFIQHLQDVYDEDGCMEIPCDTFNRSDHKNVIFK